MHKWNPSPHAKRRPGGVHTLILTTVQACKCTGVTAEKGNSHIRQSWYKNEHYADGHADIKVKKRQMIKTIFLCSAMYFEKRDKEMKNHHYLPVTTHLVHFLRTKCIAYSDGKNFLIFLIEICCASSWLVVTGCSSFTGRHATMCNSSAIHQLGTRRDGWMPRLV